MAVRGSLRHCKGNYWPSIRRICVGRTSPSLESDTHTPVSHLEWMSRPWFHIWFVLPRISSSVQYVLMLGFFVSFQPLTPQTPKDPFHFSSPECHHDSKITICSSLSKFDSSFPCANAFSTFPLLMIKGPLTTQNHDCTYLYCLYAVSAPKIQ